MSLSSITITGTVTEDAEQRYTQDNVSVLNFTMTVARYNNRDKQEKAFPVKVTVWGDQSTPLIDQVKAGVRVIVNGRLELRQMQDPSGKNIRVAEIVASSVKTVDELSKSVGDMNSQDISALQEATSAPQAGSANAAMGEVPF